MLLGLQLRWGRSLLALSCLVAVVGCPTPPPPPDGCTTSAECANNDLCDGAETCGADGLCAAGTAVDCPEGQVCVPATGLCVEGTEPPGDFQLGANAPPQEFIDARPQSVNPFAAGSEVLPAEVDLTRDAPPVGDQGQLPSCTAWAAGYASASYIANRAFGWGADSAEEQASAAYLYERLLATDNFTCPSGTLISTALNVLVQEGCSSLAAAPYDLAACPANSPNTDASNFKIGSFNRVVETDLNALRGELARGSIIVIGARLDNDFQQYVGVPEVYVGSGVPLLQGEVHAAHAMAVVGYNDNKQAFRIQNSWSTIWGDAGYMWMAYPTFQRMVFEAYALEPSSDREPDNDPVPPPTGNVELVLDDAYQFASVEPDANGVPGFVAYLVIFFHATEPVQIDTFTMTDPSGAMMEAPYGNLFSEGYVFFANPGAEWPAGIYSLSAAIADGTSNTISIDEIQIDAIDDDGGNDGGGGLCSDTCPYAYDNECDDGGENSDFSVCDFGTDCSDCGRREDEVVDPDNQCSDLCIYAGDGECDDGGPGADFAVCDFGTDCTDCGPRGREEFDGFCEDYCDFAFDGECDDGGAGSDFAVCDFGSDCADCGPRTEDDIVVDGDCFDTCLFAFDGECDDGGPGSDFDVCDFGTDCSDCGSRGDDDFFGLCEDSCPFAFDFECDDGGPGSDFDVCAFGTDCFDCGFRDEGGDVTTILCEDTCPSAFDFECDDGGPGAQFDVCDLGTDCFDCGPIEIFPDGFKAATRSAKVYQGPRTRSAASAAARTPKPSATQTTQKQGGKVRYFRGVKVVTPVGAKSMPVLGIREGVLGPNRQPVTVVAPGTEATKPLSHEATKGRMEE